MILCIHLQTARDSQILLMQSPISKSKFFWMHQKSAISAIAQYMCTYIV